MRLTESTIYTTLRNQLDKVLKNPSESPSLWTQLSLSTQTYAVERNHNTRIGNIAGIVNSYWKKCLESRQQWLASQNPVSLSCLKRNLQDLSNYVEELASIEPMPLKQFPSSDDASSFIFVRIPSSGSSNISS